MYILYDDISDDLETAAVKLNEAIKAAADLCIPKTNEKMTRENNFPSYIKEILKQRNYWRRQFRIRRDPESAFNYKDKEMEANKAIQEFKHSQWQKFLEQQGPSPLSSIPFWKRINRLRESKRKRKIETLM